MQLLANSFIENEESVLQFCNHIKLQPNIYLLTQLNTKYKLQTPINVERSDPLLKSLFNCLQKNLCTKPTHLTIHNTVFSFQCPVNLINMKFTKSFHLFKCN